MTVPRDRPSEFGYERLWYIKTRGRADKRPLEAWGGYSQDFEAANTVYSAAEVAASEHDHWAVVDIQDVPHSSFALLVFDLDVHKAPDDFDPDDITLPENAVVVRSQNGGFHIYFLVHADRGAYTESDFKMTHDLGWDIDIRGSAVSAHVVAPTEIPGVDTPYELVNDTTIPGVTDPRDAAERIRYNGESLLEFNPDRPVGSTVEIDRNVEPPAEMPACYHRGLQLRAASPDDHPNTHKVNVLTALCGLAAGYDIDAMVNHFCEEYAPDGADRERTRYQLSHIADKIDRGEYTAPAISTLRAYDILDESEGCSCSIRYHGQGHTGGSDGAPGGEYSIQRCEPPIEDAESFDAQEHWAALNERYERTSGDGVVIWADHAGAGKTTNAARAAAARDDRHAVLFATHEKAREFICDPATPDGYMHLRGAGQKQETACIDADHAEERCPDHGHGSNCPRMCPLYDLPSGHEVRARYDAVQQEVGPVMAHVLLDPHDGEDCPYIEQFSHVEHTDRVVGVHEYLSLATVQKNRQIIVDEKPRSLESKRELTIGELVHVANDLQATSGRTASAETLRELGAFAQRVVDVVTGAEDAPDSLGDVKAPRVIWNAYESYNSAAGNYLELEEPSEEWQLTEALARAKTQLNETVIARIRNDRWEGTPLCLDVLLAAAAEAGLPAGPSSEAIAVPLTLKHCPRCGSRTSAHNGARGCENCSWDEQENTITSRDGERARALAELDTDDHDIGLRYYSLPLASDLPEHALILDATATPERIGALFDATPSVEGTVTFDANLHTTQVLDGQYHGGYIRNAVTDDDGYSVSRDEWGTIADRIQRAINTAGSLHERPLFVVKKGFKDTFKFPDHAAVRHYHGLRGLNHNDCDAVMCIGAPHPRMPDLEREARLLAQHNDDLRVGGEEHSTRRTDDGYLAGNPPVYRKLRYADDDGMGRAVPTKHYTGMVGALFRENREKELVQAVHRIRPLLADTTKHAYLLTNVPTELPVDEVATFEELVDPIEALLPVPEGGLRLLEAVRDVADGHGPDGFRADSLVEQDGGEAVLKKRAFHRLARLAGLDVTYRTVSTWVNELETLGLLDAGEYEPRAGVPYAADISTLKSALSLISGNGGFKVAAVRRFSALAEAADGSLAWLEWARRELVLTGDRCLRQIGGDPPPDDAS